MILSNIDSVCSRGTIYKIELSWNLIIQLNNFILQFNIGQKTRYFGDKK